VLALELLQLGERDDLGDLETCAVANLSLDAARGPVEDGRLTIIVLVAVGRPPTRADSAVPVIFNRQGYSVGLDRSQIDLHNVDELLTVAEVAERLKLNQQTVRNMIDRRELAAVRLGRRRVRVRQSALDAFVAAGEMPAPEDNGHPEPAEEIAEARARLVRRSPSRP
jgi:excisionase family DNA binding protein